MELPSIPPSQRNAMPEAVISPQETESRMLRNYVDGNWVKASTVEYLDNRDPASGDLIGRIPLSGTAEVDAAVSAAKAAQPAWRATPPQVRARAVLALRDSLNARRQELAELVTRDM